MWKVPFNKELLEYAKHQGKKAFVREVVFQLVGAGEDNEIINDSGLTQKEFLDYCKVCRKAPWNTYDPKTRMGILCATCDPNKIMKKVPAEPTLKGKANAR